MCAPVITCPTLNEYFDSFYQVCMFNTEGRTTYRPWKAEPYTYISHCDAATQTEDLPMATCTCTTPEEWYDPSLGMCTAKPLCTAGKVNNPLNSYICDYPEDCHVTAESFDDIPYNCKEDPMNLCEMQGKYDLYGICVDYCEI